MAYEKLFEELPKGSLSDIIIRRITDALVAGELKPGDKIPTEVEFAERLGVGRNAVREAIKVLVAFGVLEIRRAKGTYVVENYNDKLLDPLLYGLILTEHSMDELLDVKIAISDAVTYLAQKHATDDQVAELHRLGERFREVMLDPASTEEQCYEASIAFNLYLGSMHGNRMLLQLDRVIHKIAAFTRHLAINRSRELGEPWLLPDNYLRQVDVIASRNMDEVGPFMDERMKVWRYLVVGEQ
ncbi:MAG: FadR family transcriptional regulator [Atopobiaceae bacterium]|nr:FadR family transcriptional regulator [Atopobiaceae bacterium]